MRFTQLIIAAVLSVLLVLPVGAAVGVRSGELQSAGSIVAPSGAAASALEGYGAFELLEVSAVSGGIVARYEAPLEDNPYVTDELPQLEMVILTYASQESAHAAYEQLGGSEESWFYVSEPGFYVDVLGRVSSEESSLHLLHVNGNLLYHVSLYRGSGNYNRENVLAFAAALENEGAAEAVMLSLVEEAKLALGLLFPPSSGDFRAKSEKSSLALTDLYEVPSHGRIEFELYVGSPASSVGTVFDSSGIDAAAPGDFYLYVQKDGLLQAGIYAPSYDADCDSQSGWYRVNASEALVPYEWNSVTLHYGVGGFKMRLEDEIVASCAVDQGRSERALYFGDYPDDAIHESFVGVLDELEFVPSVTASGQEWDEVLASQLFADLSADDADAAVFEDLYEAGVFLGSAGYLYPDDVLNRAEMVKVLLKAFAADADGSSHPFWDVPEGAWYEDYLAAAYKIGMIKGHEDGRFLPGHELNRAEFYVMLARILDSSVKLDEGYADVSSKDWFASGAALAEEAGLVTSSYFYPARSVTRREAARAIWVLMN